jgi:hypothetical protein
MATHDYIHELDRVLEFAVRHTDDRGRMVVDGEIDCKDSGWLVLAGVIRLKHAEQFPLAYPLVSAVPAWTHASVDVDDRRSAWTTFALLYAMFLSDGKSGFFYRSLSAETAAALDRFVMRIDMRFLYEASKNYQVAAGIINALRLRFGYITETDCPPEDNIEVMLDAYLGDGFFNDDDSRGSRLDRRIDGYSAEIIGLLLHYDEINDWQSPWHDRITEIVRDFCASNLHLIDARGEYAKWGRSLRGEAEAKKLMVWEYAERTGLVAAPGDGNAACAAQLDFFRGTGIGEDGQVFRDKGGNRGIWDEYTTHVQAQGYGAYGLALALHLASDRQSNPATVLPSIRENYVRYLRGPQIVCANHAATGVHCVIPLSNRLTKLMYLWHNRITGENDVSVDMSPKFMPIPYFGKQLSAPYADPHIPFLPLLEHEGELLVPRNLDTASQKIETTADGVICQQRFAYCKATEFEPASPVELTAELAVTPDSLSYQIAFRTTDDGAIPAQVCFYHPEGSVETAGDTARIVTDNLTLSYRFKGVDIIWRKGSFGPSIYGPRTNAIRACFDVSDGTKARYEFKWDKA